ncbi:MAG: imidazole glycerol phosphate synthase subunit HisF [Rubrivivax sp.]|nr:MAG: imidazole glycerol phosphate synthase subunit HisF [Rubrivivax sp.]
MLRHRAIPCLLLSEGGLVKTVQFKAGKYVGDPINALKIFNEKEVDEILFLDIDASRQGRPPDFDLIEEIASECFMPICYGGGVHDFDGAARIIRLGVEKIALNSVLFRKPQLLTELSRHFGAQSVVAVVNVKKNFWGRAKVFNSATGKLTDKDPVVYAREMEALGAGEIMLSDVDRDGTMKGFAVDLIQSIVAAVNVPVVACGGAGQLDDLRAATRVGGAAAVAVGSLFVFQGRHRAVLINYPDYAALQALFKE